VLAQSDRPVADGTYQHPTLARHQTQLGQRRYALPVPVGRLAEPVGAEPPVEDGFDLWPVGRAFEEEFQHGSSGRRVGRSPSPWNAEAVSAQPNG
jgi:hypothetical protein